MRGGKRPRSAAKPAARTTRAAPAVVDETWLAQCNEQALALLERQGRTGLGLVPFVGAGLSTAFGFQDWRSLLLGAAPPHLRDAMRSALDAGDYEGAAQSLLDDLGADGFQNMVAVAAGDRRFDEAALRAGTLSLLPLLAGGPVVTTNFDRLLEHAFAANGRAFESVVSGPRPDLIVDALHGNRRVLIKLHGDWQDRVGRTFARSDYAANYGSDGSADKRVLLESAQCLLFASRPMLFIGASLGVDRTVDMLLKVQEDYAGVRHFAVMSAPSTARAFRAKERQLRSLGVLPLWYRASSGAEHVREVEALVQRIVARISVRTLRGPRARATVRARVIAPPPGMSGMPPELNGQLERVVNLIRAGQLSLFLGSAVHWPTKLMAKHFYDELARRFDCEALASERSAVAQHIADRHGREALNGEIDKLLDRSDLQPREAHQLLAAWPQLYGGEGQPPPWPTVFTTNYDDVLERHLAGADVPFHLLTYHNEGEWRGLFSHLDVDGSLRIVERPRNLLRLAPAMVVVKLNGGQNQGLGISRSYVTTMMDYIDLAARIPEGLPAVLRRTLEAHPLLFLGHGLVESDVESVLRFAHQDHRGMRSWAVVKGKPPERVAYWSQCGVQIVDQPVNLYTAELHRRLARAARP
ncbi:SIR2 family protein [Aquincola sp. S2]|uniref:SIR2 family protein n=1 Tax=Pseudaquabacterium terrae TaxID=2732868 RepID=A0ABX2EAD7_9BURK|nr:SIR2 family protein [Aquabacterium terrae]NRF65783.1 SIR2 family protein [Aquabacterium terrae]